MIDRIQKGENNTTEFKSTLRWNINLAAIDQEMERAVLKTIAAFLNSNGGILFIGVNDEKQILGLHDDFATFSKPDKEDAFQQHFDALIEKAFDNTFHLFIKFGFDTVKGQTISVIEVRAANRPVFIKIKPTPLFYVRRTASTVSLDHQQTAAYVFEKWHHQPAATAATAMFDSETNFRKQLKWQLEQKGSALQEEINNNWNSYFLITNNPLLKMIMVDHLAETIGYGLLPLIADYSARHLNYEEDWKYIYNQEHVHTHIREDEGYDLPVYYSICFIGILYATAIRNKVDIDRLATHSGTMRSIFGSMVKNMIGCMEPNPDNQHKEYPSNYHWLIGEILDKADNWMSSFDELENFDPNSSYLETIPSMIAWCFDELYAGEEKGILDTRFINSQLYYHCLTTYFTARTNDAIRGAIEEYIISKIPKKLITSILEFALNQKFALDVDHVIEGRFRTVNKHEVTVLTRFRSFLLDNKLL